MSLFFGAEARAYEQYRQDRERGMSHAQIVADGVYPDAEAYALRYSEAIAMYVDAMNKRTERDNIGDLDTFGHPLRAGT